MSKSGPYNVYSAGGVSGSNTPSDVAAAFAKLFGVSSSEASAFTEAKKLIKQGLSEERAHQYERKLTEIGLPAIIEDTRITDPDSYRHLSLAPVEQSTLEAEQAPSPVADNQPVEPSPKAAATAAAVSVNCPKCDLLQANSEQCVGCAIYFAKYRSRTSTASPQPDKPQTATGRPDHGLSVASLALPLIAAVLGALAWKFIALGTGYEYGLIAWAIGGAVGGAAALAGGKGELSGGVCAALTLAAIFAGKLMIVTDYRNEMDQLLSSDHIGAAIEEYQIDYERESQALEQISSDAEMKHFMVEYGYSDASTGALVSDAELRHFRQDIQPWLEEGHDWQVVERELQAAAPQFAAAMSDYSATRMVFDNLDFIDFLFALFGVTTAYRLGRGAVS